MLYKDSSSEQTKDHLAHNLKSKNVVYNLESKNNVVYNLESKNNILLNLEYKNNVFMSIIDLNNLVNTSFHGSVLLSVSWY